MSSGWQKSMMAFLGMAGAIAGLLAYLQPSASRDLASTPAGIEEKIDAVAADLKTMKVENEIRRVARDKEIAGIHDNINQKFLLLMDGINKLDNRLFEMRRSHKSARLDDENEDGS